MTGTQKRSWSELLTAVKATRNKSWCQSSRIPNNFTFSDTRLYFLAVPEGRGEYTLFYVDLKIDDIYELPRVVPTASWHQLLDLTGLRTFQGFSREEELLRERKRLGSFGITSYEYDKNSRSILFPACSSLYMCRDQVLPSAPGDANARLVPGEVRTQTKETRMDPKISPSNPNAIAFIHHNDIWVCNVASQKEKRLSWTTSGKPSACSSVDEPISAGVPSFVAQEEFDRYTGYWWRPVTQRDNNGHGNKYCILYEEVDESEVEILTMTPSIEATAPPSCESYRYPRAGTQNAISSLKLVEFCIDDSGEFSGEEVTYELKVSLHEAFPWMEYVVRCGWLPCGKSVWAQLLDRSQQRLALVVIPLSLFIRVKTAESMDDDGECPAGTMKIVVDEKSDVWINVCDVIHFLEPRPSNPDLVQFIWSSEISGFRHLYLNSCNFSDEAQPLSDIVSKQETICRQFTSGTWEVAGSKIWVDESNEIVYFMATKNSPIEQHLYAASYGSVTSTICLLTQPGFSHAVTMNEDCSMFVSVYSSTKDSPAVSVYRIIHSSQRTDIFVKAQPYFHIRPPGQLNESLSPELLKLRSKHGHDVYGMVFKPPNMQPKTKYPTVLFIYGGPSVQIVTNSHKGVRYLRLQTLAIMGYVVVAFDCRGSYHRGRDFEAHLKNNLGCVEIDDQVDALLQHVETAEYVDIKRIAIHGWSYGGYLSLQGLIQRPEIFKVAIAGAPVTDWEAYDTGYTERYIDTPQMNPLAYGRSSVLNNVNLFPDEQNRLLIVHGLIDENVHFHHTSLLIDRLIKAGKPYQLQIYPSERHGIRQARASEHYEACVLSFLENNL